MSAATAPRRQAPLAAPPRPRRDRARRHLRVVEDQPRRHPVVFLALYLVVATAVVLGAVSLNALAAGGAVEAKELASRVQQAERQHGLLVAEVAHLENPARIREAADDGRPGAGRLAPRSSSPGAPCPRTRPRVPPPTTSSSRCCRRTADDVEPRGPAAPPAGPRLRRRTRVPGPGPRRRMAGLLAVYLLGLALLGARLAQVQVVEAERYADLSVAQRIRTVELPAHPRPDLRP